MIREATPSSPLSYIEWKRYTENQIEAVALLYGREHASERKKARDILCRRHECKPEVYPYPEMAEHWEEMWWAWWQEVKDVTSRVLRALGPLNVSNVRAQVGIMQGHVEPQPFEIASPTCYHHSH